MKKLLILALLLALFTFSVKAACCEYDFGFGDYYVPSEGSVGFAYHQGDYSICEGDAKAVPIMLENKIDADNIYDFMLAGADFGILSGKRFELGAKQKGIVALYLSPESGNKGEYAFSVIAVEKRGGITKKGAINVNVDNCFDFNVSLEENDKICGCGLNNYDITLENKGKYKGNFNISLEGPEWANLGNSAVDIEAGSKGTVNLEVNPPCNASGRHSISVLANLKGYEGISSKNTLSLDVIPANDCYKAKIIAKNTKIDYSGGRIEVSVENKGEKRADYSVSLDAPEWVRASTTSLNLDKGGEGKFYIDLKPGEDVKAGTYYINISLNAGESSYTEAFKVKVTGQSELLKKIKDGIVYYRYYAYLGIVVLLVILGIVYLAKRMPKRKKKPVEKRKFSWLYGLLAIAILLAIAAYLLVRYGLMGIVKDFLVLYYTYIIIGFVLLFVLLLIIRFYKSAKALIFERKK